MKRQTKIWLIAGAVLVLLGCLTFLGVMLRNGWNFAALGTETYTDRTYEISGSFRDIALRCDTEDITFLPSEDGKCRVLFREPEKRETKAEVRDGALVIEVLEPENWTERVTLISTESPKITVYLPKGEYGALSVTEDTGDVTLPGDFSFGEITVNLSTGDMSCAASCTGPLHIKASTGDIRLENLSAGEMSLAVSTGHVEVRGADCAGDFTVTVDTGKAALTDVTCRSFTSGGNTGDLTLENLLAGESITLRRSTGDVRLERCDAARLLIETDTGDVTGSLRTEKVFIARSDTGAVDVPETVTGGTCKVTTDTGDIRLTVDGQ